MELQPLPALSGRSGHASVDSSALRKEDEDRTFHDHEDSNDVEGFIGYRDSLWRLGAFCIGVVLTGGALGLLALWFPRLWATLTKKRCSMAEATSFLVRAQGRYAMAYVMKEWDDVRWFEFQQLRFVYQPESFTFVRLQPFSDLRCVDIPKQTKGLDRDVALHRLRMSGPNAFSIPLEPILIAWLRVMLSPFHIFILATCVLWFVDDYTVYASIILAITFFSVSVTVYEERRSIRRIQTEINQQSIVETRRNGSWVALQSGGLVHGDIITLTDNQVVPADVVIVSGQCVVDESQLTGESTPVRKYTITEREDEEDDENQSIYSQVQDVKHTLFSGTRILKAMPSYGMDRVQGFVYSTGFNTRKGGLIRRILYPSEIVFRYRKHTTIFILGLIFVAPIVFVISFYFWDQYNVGTWDNILRSCEILTVLVPVTIPIMQLVAQGIAAINLRQYGIYTIAPSRILMGGKIRVMCFDKTGTLTENGLSLTSALPTQFTLEQVKRASGKGKQKADAADPSLVELDSSLSTNRVRFVQQAIKASALSSTHLIKQIMACCHSATNVEGEGMIGHPLDVEMFYASAWQMMERKDGTVFSSSSKPLSVYSTSSTSSSSTYSTSSSEFASLGRLSDIHSNEDALELKVLKIFPFDHSLRRMSVIVKSLQDNSIHLFSKGSPETIRDLSLPETVPPDLDEILRLYARKGHYILGIGAKLNVLDEEEEVHHLSRKNIDKDLIFLGLLIFQNKVREDTTQVISNLKGGDVRNIIITGDGPYTALAVARECGILDSGTAVALGHTGKDGTSSLAEQAAPFYGLQWINIDTGSDIGQEWTERHVPSKPMRFSKFQTKFKTGSGGVFERFRRWKTSKQADERDHLTSAFLDNSSRYEDVERGNERRIREPKNIEDRDFQPEELILTGNAFDYLKTNDPQLLGRLLFDVRVFARFSPQQKAEVVNLINSTGLVTGMCGDGGNDCGALRAAHAGIAVGGGGVEASVVSPFTYSLPSIRCTEILIREGRGALANSLSAFKLLVLIYVVIMHTVILMLYNHGSDFSDGMYIVQDLVIVFPLSLFILYPNAAAKLTDRRPSASLLNSTVIASMLGQSAIVIAFVVGARELLFAEPWYKPFDPVSNGASARKDYWLSYETTTLWLFGNFQYIASAVAFSIGFPFRKEIWHNYLMVFNVIIALAVASWLTLVPFEWMRDLLYMEDLEPDFKIKLYFMAIGCMITQVLYEAVVTMGPFAWIMQRVGRWLNLRKKHRLRL